MFLEIFYNITKYLCKSCEVFPSHPLTSVQERFKLSSQ